MVPTAFPVGQTSRPEGGHIRVATSKRGCRHSRGEFSSNTEAHVVRTARPVIMPAGRRAEGPRRVVPAAAANHALFAIPSIDPRRPVTGRIIVVLVPAVLDPLRCVAQNVVQAESVLRVAPHRDGSQSPVAAKCLTAGVLSAHICVQRSPHPPAARHAVPAGTDAAKATSMAGAGVPTSMSPGAPGRKSRTRHRNHPFVAAGSSRLTCPTTD